MPTGIYVRTEEHRKANSLCHKGQTYSDEQRKLVSRIAKERGIGKWNKGKIGPMLGNHPSEKTKLKMSIAHKGNRLTEEHKRKISVSSFGKIMSHRGKIWSEKRRIAQLTAKKKLRIKPVIRNGKEYSPDWHEIRKIVYKRDNYKCQECGVHCSQKGKTKIQAHHIDYDVLNNDLINLITLCSSCHAKTNFKKTDWTKYFIAQCNRPNFTIS